MARIRPLSILSIVGNKNSSQRTNLSKGIEDISENKNESFLMTQKKSHIKDLDIKATPKAMSSFFDDELDFYAQLRGFAEGSSGVDLFKRAVMLNTVELLEEIGINIKNMREGVENKISEMLNGIEMTKEMRDRLKIRGWKIEVEEEEGMDVQSRYEEADGGLARIRISKGLVEFLKKIKTEKSEEEYESLIQEIFLHERIEMLYRQRHPEASAQVAHEFAIANSGERQKNLVKALPIIEELSKIESGNKMSREKLDSVQKMIDEIKVLMGVSESGIYRMYSNVERSIVNTVAENSYSNKEIVLEINGKSVEGIKSEVNRLKIENKVGLTIILVGEPTEIGKIGELESYILENSNPMMRMEWIIGRAVYGEVQRGRLRGLQESGQIEIARAMGNGYLLTASGIVSESLYSQLLMESEKGSLSSREIAMILNNEMLEGRYNGLILKSFVSGKIAEISAKVNQLIVGLEVELIGEAKEMAETIVNKNIEEKSSIKVLETTEEGIVLGSELSLKEIESSKDLLEIKIPSEKVKSVKVLGREKIELEGIDKKVIGLTKMSEGIKRSLMSVAVKIGISRFMKSERTKGLNLDVKTIKAIASAA
jgi:hypothetical protein